MPIYTLLLFVCTILSQSELGIIVYPGELYQEFNALTTLVFTSVTNIEAAPSKKQRVVKVKLMINARSFSRIKGCTKRGELVFFKKYICIYRNKPQFAQFLLLPTRRPTKLIVD